jgi:hypothetical protein
MKQIQPYLSLAACLLLFTIFSCRKSASVATPTPPQQTITQGNHDSTQIPKDSSTAKPPAYPQSGVTGCSYAPNYGDTIVFPQPTNGSDYIIKPINNPGAGKYFAWPIGMAIDSATGAIDLTKSETGLKYVIGFVKAGTTDTCLNPLIIAGASYMDSVYVVSSGQNQAMPYFDANPNLTNVCNGPGNPCSFDVTGSAANQKVIVDPNSGQIDLTKTLNGTGLLGGAFGVLPVNGQVITTTIYYKLNDSSKNALQHIDVQVEYYDNPSLISSGVLGAVTMKLDNLTSGNLISNYANPRPPLIIIVRHP